MVRECCSANYLSGQAENRNGDLNGDAEIINRDVARRVAIEGGAAFMRATACRVGILVGAVL